MQHGDRAARPDAQHAALEGPCRVGVVPEGEVVGALHGDDRRGPGADDLRVALAEVEGDAVEAPAHAVGGHLALGGEQGPDADRQQAAEHDDRREGDELAPGREPGERIGDLAHAATVTARVNRAATSGQSAH